MFKISGAGCVLLDYIYSGVDFTSPALGPFRSRRSGDGGLEPGALVFADDFERYCGVPVPQALKAIAGGRAVDATNVGGPSVVALINAAQLLDPTRFAVHFVGAYGADEAGADLEARLGATALKDFRLVRKAGATPCTNVLSDPGHDGGKGERTFLNTVGAAGELVGADLGDAFWDADLIAFGGTALVPRLHDELTELLAEAKARGAFTVVNTVYDFRHQRENPRRRWPLGSSDASYGNIDLLIADSEEALRLSGTDSLDAALDFFEAQGVGAAVVTNGARDVALRTRSSRFRPCPAKRLPVCDAITDELKAHPERRGDTTGCGDNFAGGLIADLARQLESGARELDLVEALALASVSGGAACFHMGGVFKEKAPGEKRAFLESYLAEFRGVLAALDPYTKK